MTPKKHKPTRPYGGIDARERRKARQEAFVKAGLEAFGTTGYVNSTIKDICEIAGLTQRYFYESFRSKEDLLVAVYRKLIEDIESEARVIFEQCKDSPEDMVYKLLKMFYQRFKDDRRLVRVQLFEVLGVSPRVDSEYQSAMSTLTDWIKLTMFSVFPGLQEKCRDGAVIFTGLAGAMIQIAHQWVAEGLTIPVEEVVYQTSNMFFVLGKYYKASPKNPSKMTMHPS